MPFPPWPQPCVESHGDYREDAWLESHIGGPLYEKQAELPHLPIPDITATIQRFLPTALPLASSKEEQDNLMKACQDFPQQAKILQERLIDYKEKSCQNASWLQHWWQTQGYLQVRNSLLEVSYFLFIPDDTSLSNCDTTTTTNIGDCSSGSRTHSHGRISQTHLFRNHAVRTHFPNSPVQYRIQVSLSFDSNTTTQPRRLSLV